MHRADLALLDALDARAGTTLLPERLSVCLITAFNLADLLDPELTADAARTTTGAQLGILTLAAILRNRGHPLDIIELDSLFLELLDLRKGGRDGQRGLGAGPSTLLPRGVPLIPNLFEFAKQRLSKVSADVFGFSSICSSYPLTLRLADVVKQRNRGKWVVLGGPQASVVDVPTLSAFAAIDFILRGEADQTFPALLDALGRGHGWDQIAGLTFRSDSQVKRNPNAPVVLELDHLPMPAFDLDADLKNRGGVHLEMGRGCPFACTFCSTNDFFRRNFRLKSAERVIQEMDHLRREYGTTYFSLVHDMYTVDRRKVAAFCRALLAHRAGHTWGCSARTDCIDDELIALMAEAGCRGIFFGIETGSRRLQKVIRKNLDLDEAVERIACADRHGIKTAVALIIGFPDETREDLRDTIHFFIDSLRFDHAEPQLSLLAPLAATPLHEEHHHELMFDRIYSDISCQSWDQDPVEEEMIRAHPDIFPNFLRHSDRSSGPPLPERGARLCVVRVCMVPVASRRAAARQRRLANCFRPLACLAEGDARLWCRRSCRWYPLSLSAAVPPRLSGLRPLLLSARAGQVAWRGRRFGPGGRDLPPGPERRSPKHRRYGEVERRVRPRACQWRGADGPER
jgi:radical SAM superfamily enzyme YgiQ (UPF0313 family)